MRIHGRISIYGEYLMHGSVHGLAVPTESYLTSDPDDLAEPHPYYSAQLDTVASNLQLCGLPIAKHISGTLPLGKGLGSSAVLARVHLGMAGTAAFRAAVRHSEDILHGFSSSGFDAECVLQQTAGLFNAGQWRRVDVLPFDLWLVDIKKEKSKTLPEIQATICSDSRRLIRIAKHLNSHVLRSGSIDFDALYDYSQRLASLHVYSTVCSDLVSMLLAKGLIAKCVGGLYDKLLLVVNPGDAYPLATIRRFAPEYEVMVSPAKFHNPKLTKNATSTPNE